MQTHYLNRALTLLLAALPFPAIAEEGGSGHYFPGSMSSFVDGVPAAEAVIVRLNALTYDGSIDANVTVPIAGQTITQRTGKASLRIDPPRAETKKR